MQQDLNCLKLAYANSKTLMFYMMLLNDKIPTNLNYLPWKINHALLLAFFTPFYSPIAQ